MQQMKEKGRRGRPSGRPRLVAGRLDAVACDKVQNPLRNFRCAVPASLKAVEKAAVLHGAAGHGRGGYTPARCVILDRLKKGFAFHAAI
jgi:hypothetical protein